MNSIKVSGCHMTKYEGMNIFARQCVSWCSNHPMPNQYVIYVNICAFNCPLTCFQDTKLCLDMKATRMTAAMISGAALCQESWTRSVGAPWRASCWCHHKVSLSVQILGQSAGNGAQEPFLVLIRGVTVHKNHSSVHILGFNAMVRYVFGTI